MPQTEELRKAAASFNDLDAENLTTEVKSSPKARPPLSPKPPNEGASPPPPPPPPPPPGLKMGQTPAPLGRGAGAAIAPPLGPPPARALALAAAGGCTATASIIPPSALPLGAFCFCFWPCAFFWDDCLPPKNIWNVTGCGVAEAAAPPARRRLRGLGRVAGL